MANLVMRSTEATSLEIALNKTIDDKERPIKMYYNKWLKEESGSGGQIDDLETYGPGLAFEVPEGTELPSATMGEHTRFRYIPVKYGVILQITEEALEDNKHPQVLRLAQRTKRAIMKTIEVVSHDLLNRMFNSSYPIGDGLALGSASHTLGNGGTFSNYMAAPQLSPSITALERALSDITAMVGHDGEIEGYNGKRVVCPHGQKFAWKQILKSGNSPETYQGINAVSASETGLEAEPVATPFWNASTTNWCIQTDADNPAKIYFWRRPRGRAWREDGPQVMRYSTDTRFVVGCSDARAFYCVEA
jgi:hypothetical protein